MFPDSVGSWCCEILAEEFFGVCPFGGALKFDENRFSSSNCGVASREGGCHCRGELQAVILAERTTLDMVKGLDRFRHLRRVSFAHHIESKEKFEIYCWSVFPEVPAPAPPPGTRVSLCTGPARRRGRRASGSIPPPCLGSGSRAYGRRCAPARGPAQAACSGRARGRVAQASG